MYDKMKTVCCRFWKGRQGQASLEYVLMLGSIMVIISAFITAFHKDIVRWFFMFIGNLLTR